MFIIILLLIIIDLILHCYLIIFHTLTNNTMDVANVLPLITTYVDGVLTKKNALKAKFQEEWLNIEFLRETARRRMASLEARAVAINVQISSTNSEIATYTTIINSLSAGAIKNDFIEKKTIAEQDLFRLNIRARSVGGLALVNLKIQIEELTAQWVFMNQLHTATSDLNAL